MNPSTATAPAPSGPSPAAAATAGVATPGGVAPGARRRRRRRPDLAGPDGDLTLLVVAARQGDAGALEELVRATYPDAYTLAFRLTGNEEDARDVVQEAYLRAQRGLGRFRGDSQFTTWLYRITANCASTLLSKRRRSATVPLSDELPVADARPERDPEWRAASQSDRAAMTASLAELPPRLRTVIVLRDIYDLPHQAIAEQLGISEAAAKVRLHRARRRLKESIAGRGRDGDAG